MSYFCQKLGYLEELAPSKDHPFPDKPQKKIFFFFLRTFCLFQLSLFIKKFDFYKCCPAARHDSHILTQIQHISSFGFWKLDLTSSLKKKNERTTFTRKQHNQDIHKPGKDPKETKYSMFAHFFPDAGVTCDNTGY